MWVGGTLGLAGLLFGGAWLAVRALPGWAEVWVVHEMREAGLEAEAFPISRIGLTGSRAGSSWLGKGDHRLDWESIEVSYLPHHLLAGRVERLELAGPSLRIRLPLESPFTVAVADGMPPATEERPPSLPPPSATEDPLEREPPAEPPAVVEAPPAAVEEPPGLAALIGRIPLSVMDIEDGRLEVTLAGAPLFAGEWESHLSNRPGALEGSFFFSGEALSTRLTLTGDADAVLTLHNHLELDLQGALALAATLAEAWELPVGLPELRAAAPLVADVLVEADASGAATISGEGRIASLGLRWPGMADWLTVAEALVAGTHESGRTRLQAGLRMEDFRMDGFEAAGFGARGGYDSVEGFTLESEPVAFAWQGWSGTVALRGDAAPLPAQSGKVEAAFSAITGPGMRIDPASVLLQLQGATLRASASPLAVTRAATLWIEDWETDFAIASGDLSSTLMVYNTVGSPVGKIALEAQTGVPGRLSASMELQDSGGAPALDSRFELSVDGSALYIGGKLPLDWINLLNRWAGLLPAGMHGLDPRLEARLFRSGSLVTGNALLALEDLDVRLDAGTLVEGVSGECRVRVRGLPQTEGLQELRIQSVTTGEVRLEDLLVEWALPTVRHLRVQRATARLAGGLVELVPFTLDPLAPEFRTAVRLRGIPANVVLEWLDESRFRVRGTLSGSIPLHWREGMLEIGGSRLEMDPSEQGNRFLFTDRDFLVRQFGSLGGIPKDLLDPFLDALVHDGIRISSLVLETVPLPARREVSLRLTVSGEAGSSGLIVPIRGLVINNVISEEDLGHLLGMAGPLRFRADP